MIVISYSLCCFIYNSINFRLIMFLFFHYFSSLLNICVILKTMVGLAKQVDLFKHWKLLGARMNYEYKIL